MMRQDPAPDAFLLRWKGDALPVTLTLDAPRSGRAVLRTEIGGAATRRRETIAWTETGATPLEKAWRDVPMDEVSPGVFTCTVPLDEVGVFAAKACFFPEGAVAPEWPEGGNLRVKVEPAVTRRANSIYTVFVRQFGSFRETTRRLGHIMDRMGFRIVQTLPPFPVPVTYAVMGDIGCPFASTDFFSVDPAMAEFDERATPLDQFRELIDAVHAKGGSLFIDLPANHTGWASALQTHHPEWFQRAPDGRFVSPGAWGVTWADLVALDYVHAGLRAYMADVFLFWCRQGVDGFRCDAGYMIPEATWTYIVARVREEYPDTVFMLEGLGGEISVTDALLARAGLDWAYSEIFQTYDRGGFERYLPGAIDRAEKYGTLVHFAETHDNDRLAKGGTTWARLRVRLAALLSHQGAWGIANGVEWFATEKIEVHGATDLNWGASENLVDEIGRLNALLASHPAFGPAARLALVTRGDGNTLAVLRAAAELLLVLANLDCGRGATIRWEAAGFAAGEAEDLLTGRTVTLDPASGLALGPGELLCLARRPRAGFEPEPEERPPVSAQPAMTWRYPYDLRREVCVPTGCALRVEAPHPFRARLVRDGRTIAVARAHGAVRAVTLVPDAYAGDGTRGDRLRLDLAVYAPAGVTHASAAVVLPPPARAARAKVRYTGDDVRRDPALETILANGAGAAARVKLAWGEIRSQYDALFAANTQAEVPGDRLVLWTRCRAWLRHEGYSRAFNRDVLEEFRADPAGRAAEWIFRVPCGLGRAVRVVFTFALAEGQNAARLQVRRLVSDTPEPEGSVQIVFRPDLEWRSFHGVTKAQGAVEAAFGAPKALTAHAGGFTFNPYGDRALHFTSEGAAFHPEAEWTYCAGHPEEAARGQEPCGDLYSPGWFSCDLAPQDAASLVSAWGRVREPVFPAAPSGAEPTFPAALRAAMRLFFTRRDDVKTVIAGYPWFLDWGRDTFIFLRGAIAAGFTQEARAIVVAFARFEEKGTLPNIIYGTKAGNRDTVDAPLWFVLAARDLAAALGPEVLETDCTPVGAVWTRTLADVIVSICENYLAGTPNGIRVDAESALVWSPAHFTWMDTNYPAFTPRTGYAVEIQALWIAALRFTGGRDFPRLIPGRGGEKWRALADRAATSLVWYFARDGRDGLADCLDAPNGEPAALATPDWGVRPNQLFVLSLDALPRTAASLRAGILRATERLLVPGGVRSLADDGDARYRGVYAGDEDTQRKPAYHNGTVWAWPFPLWAEAAVKTGFLPKGATLSLLASVVENLNAGCVCQVSEIADGDAPHAQKGCRAQAWSVSELYRVWSVLMK